MAVVGRSGCGKSTLLRLLAGLEQTTQGELLAGNAPLHTAREDTRLMFQDARLLPCKRVIDNVGLGLKGREWRSAALEALETVGLAERARMARRAVWRPETARGTGARADSPSRTAA